MDMRVAGGVVVKTQALLKAVFLTMLGSRHVFEMHAAQERRQGTSLLVDSGESALCGRQDRAASGVVSWRGQ